VDLPSVSGDLQNKAKMRCEDEMEFELREKRALFSGRFEEEVGRI
jgi:hypothetical protein